MNTFMPYYYAGDVISSQQETHQMVGQAKRRATKIRLESLGGGIFDGFFRDNFRPEVAGHVISGVAAE